MKRFSFSSICRAAVCAAFAVVVTGAGCGLTCELQGVPHDFADCETAESALSGNELTGGEKRDLRECIAASCGEGEETPAEETSEE